MNKVKSIIWGAVVVALSVAFASLVNIRPSAPRMPGIFEDANPFKFILGNEESLANSIFGPHVWYSQANAQGNGETPGGATYTPAILPANPDHLPVCFELNFAYMINAGATTVYAGPGDGTTHSIDSGCPLWPYYNIAGHAFGAGFVDNTHLGHLIPTNGNSVEAMDFRQDGMYFNSTGNCGGGIVINSASCSAGTCTLNLASDPRGSFGSGLWSGTGNGEYMQISGATGGNTVWNTTPGSVLTVTGRSASTLTFAGNIASCSSNCGSVSQPYLVGPPPVTTLVGTDGNNPEPEFAVINAANSVGNLNWSETINVLCFPLLSCTNQNVGCSQLNNGGIMQ